MFVLNIEECAKQKEIKDKVVNILHINYREITIKEYDFSLKNLY